MGSLAVASIWKKLDTAAPTTVLILAPRSTAAATTSMGVSDTSIEPPISACTPSGAAGMVLSSHTIPACWHQPLLRATRIIRFPEPG